MAATNSAFMKPMTVSPELAAVIGAGPMPRSEVVKKLWVYIKKNNLQDPSNKPDINFGYGYGNERFFWALLSACGIFFIGAGVTLYNGISSLIRPEPIEIHAL